MKRISVLTLLLNVALLTFAQTGEVFNVNNLSKNGTLVTGWKFHAGDDMKWSETNFVDSKWDSIHPEENIFDLPQVRNAGVCWFRIKLRVDSAMFNKTLAMTIYQSGASEIYLNGKLIYGLGNVSTGPDHHSVRLIDDHLALKLGQAPVQELAVRYSISKTDFLVNLYHPNYCVKLSLAQLNDVFGNSLSEAHLIIIQNIILVILNFLLASMALLLYFYNRAQKAYLYFGYSSLISVVRWPLSLPADFTFNPGLFATSVCIFLTYIVITASGFLLLMGLQQLFKPKRDIFFYFILFYSILTLPTILLFPSAGDGFNLFGGIIYAIASYRLTLIGVRKGISGAKILFIAMNLFVILIIAVIFLVVKGNYALGLIVGTIVGIVLPGGLAFFLAHEFAWTGVALKRRIVEVQQLSEKSLAQEQEKQQLLANQNVVLEQQVEERTAELNRSLNNLKATQTQLIQSEKMASLGELTAGIAHEIQNPLNFVNNFSEVNREMLQELKAESEKPKAERDERLEIELINDLIGNEEKINHHGKRADAIVKGMLQHSQSGSGAKEPTNINSLADEYMRLSYHGLRSKDKSFNAEMVTHFDEKLPQINVIPQDIGRVLLNLFNNAFYAVNQKQKTAGEGYKAEVSVTTLVENRHLVIKVKDSGIGIPDSIKDKVMQPFFTTKPTGEGTGLGLSLTYDMVVKGHGGSIQVNTKESEFTEFVVSFPLG